MTFKHCFHCYYKILLRFISVLIFTLITFGSIAQQSITLDDVETGLKSHVACKSIDFLPGYFYDAQTSQMDAYITPDGICDVEYLSQEYNPTNLGDINRDLPVGSTTGIIDVSPTGACVYNVPLLAPPGTMGMSPNLSINYNSQSGNGTLGIGWNLAGNCISSITRAPKNYHYDGKVTPIQIDNEDRFALDGMRLIPPAASANGLDNVAYKTEIESYSQIVSHGQSGSGPAYFTVTTKDGLLYEYGSTADAFIEASGTATAILWLLNKIIDRNGNYLSVYYNENVAAGKFNIDRITYTGNDIAGISPYNEVKFIYSTRNDKQLYYISGYSITNDVLLSSIQFYSNDRIVRKYELNYSDNVYAGARLSEIVEIGIDNIRYNPIKIGWSKSENSNYLNPEENSGESALGLVPISPTANIKSSGDFNGDGFTDFFVNYLQINNPISTGLDVDLYLNNNGLGYPQRTSTGSMPLSYKNTIKTYADGSRREFMADVDGDGDDDLIYFGINSSNNYYFNVRYNGSTSISDDGTPFVPTAGNNATDNSNGTGNLNPGMGFYTLTGDFNGDGFADLFVYFYDKDWWYITDFAIHGAILEGNVNFGDSRVSFTAIDFNGDGKDEIMYTCPVSGGTEHHNIIGLNTQINSFETISQGTWPNSCVGHDGVTYPGDFNGDGSTDLLIWSGCNYTWSIAYAKRTNSTSYPVQFQEFSAPFHESNPRTSQTYECFVADFNGDGKSDIALFYHYFNDINDEWDKFVNIYYSLGNNKFQGENVLLDNNIIPAGKSVVGDFDGNGRADIIYAKAAPRYHYGIYFKGTGSMAIENYNKVTSITNGFGGSVFIDYNTLPRLARNGKYSKSGTANLSPVRDFQGPICVVQNIKSSDGFGGYTNSIYSYLGAKIHTMGKGLLGFEKISVHNDIQSITVETEYGRFSSVLMYPIRKTINYNGIPNSEKIMTYNFPSQGLNYKMELASLTITDPLTGNTSLTTYDNYVDGNAKHEVTNVNNGLLITEVNNDFVAIPPSTILSKLSTSIKTTTTQFDNSTDNIHFEYNSYGQLTHKYEQYSTPREVLTHYTYTGLNLQIGIPSSVEISSIGVLPNLTSYEYDSKYRFITKETNTLNQVVETVYDSRIGAPKQIKGIDGLVTKFDYDGFGRAKKTIYPDNLISEVKLNWVYPGSMSMDDPLSILSNIWYSSTSTFSGQPTTKQYFDILGRALQTETDGFGDKLYMQYSYYPNGLPKSETASFKQGSSSPLITTYVYQGTNRPSDLLSAAISDGVNSRTTNYNYNYSSGNIDVTISEPSSSSRTITNALGQVITAFDDGGTISYQYTSRNQLKEVRVNGELAVVLTYDASGFQTSLYDKDAGYSTYVYDNFGRLKKQIDANNNVTDLEYRELGRLHQKITRKGSDIYTYSYDYVQYGSNGVNKLEQVSVSGPEGVFNDTYTYDVFGRTISHSQLTDGENFVTNFTYNSKSNLETTTYPGGFSIRNEYTNTGFLNKISDIGSGSMLWHAVETNDLGQVKEYKLGHQPLTSKIEYDNFGYVTRFSTPGIQDLNLEFNIQDGNLDWRQDLSNGRNLKEEFYHGILDRLQTASVVTPIVQTPIITSFGPNGRIDSKSDAGQYDDYNASHLDAVENIYGFSNNIPTTPQELKYTPFNKVRSIEEGHEEVFIKYGTDNQRKKLQSFHQGNLIFTRYYHPNYEKEVSGTLTREINYIQSPTGLIAMHVVENGVQNTYFVFKDHLGSILKLTDMSGNTIAEQNFDPWGRRRNPDDWTYSSITTSPLLYRGFTGHEHLPQFNLINMNGRMYDPVLGVMLSPDNYVQSETTGNYNRYSYCFNNPLKYTDPDGEWVHIVVGAAIGGAINLGIKASHGKINSWGDGFAAFGIGAFAGAVGAATGGAAFLSAGGGTAGAGGFIAGASGGLMGTAYSSPILSSGNSAYFGDPMMTDKQYLMSIGIGALAGGFINGGIATYNGRNFWNGILPPKQPITPMQPLPAKPIPTENRNNNLDLSRQEIKQAIPDNGPVNYEAEYFHKVTGVDCNHNWNRTTIEIVADNGQIFPNSIGQDGKPQILIQMVSDKYGTSGVFEIVIRDGVITHQRFIPGGVVTGFPNQLVPGAPGGIGHPFPWWR